MIHSYRWSMNSTCTTTLQHTYLKHTWNSPLICCVPRHGPPHIEKEIHSVVNGGRVGDTSGSCVPPEWTRCRVCLPCAQPLHFSAYFPRGGSAERHRFEAHTATRAFLMPAVAAHSRSPIPVCFFPLPSDFFFFFAKAKLLHLFSNVRTSCTTTANISVCPRLFTA